MAPQESNKEKTLPVSKSASNSVQEPSIAESSTEEYSVFTKSQKRWITFTIAFVAWFSTLSSFVYFPAVSLIASDLHTTIEGVNITITSYLIASAIIPSVIGPVADMTGRRPVYIVTLFIYFMANIGIALQKSLASLIILRMVQSAGISGSFAVNYGKRK
ncbi:hypothetical protein HYALB_00007272 [Hymenoscyphus albidus]|uniref:Major facilitator superfamily (MFS) profile domain-containing protein n=1 Tax=Hymenoscyphus albidus TaxID=595503 RepID=A0A9N9LIM3_9HELO|nr:hypothetical protein HYALB_00007272 [Hymenoscyphus albidus]